MTAAQSARIAIVCYSLSITGSLILFLILAQPIGIRFNYSQEENLRLIDVITPTFFGYLGAASHFIFNSNKGREVSVENEGILRLLIHGPFIIFILLVGSVFYTFYYTNLPQALDDKRIAVMSFNSLSRYLSICLAILAVTVSIISSYLFGAPPSAARVPAARKEGQ